MLVICQRFGDFYLHGLVWQLSLPSESQTFGSFNFRQTNEVAFTTMIHCVANIYAVWPVYLTNIGGRWYFERAFGLQRLKY